MPLPVWLSAARDGGSVVALHVQPGARSSEIVGVHGEALKIRLAAPPVDGKANAALLRFLANRLGLPATSLQLLAGASSRQKRVAVPLAGADVAVRLRPG